jgi:hypothetical protein
MPVNTSCRTQGFNARIYLFAESHVARFSLSLTNTNIGCIDEIPKITGNFPSGKDEKILLKWVYIVKTVTGHIFNRIVVALTGT